MFNKINAIAMVAGRLINWDEYEVLLERTLLEVCWIDVVWLFIWWWLMRYITKWIWRDVNNSFYGIYLRINIKSNCTDGLAMFSIRVWSQMEKKVFFYSDETLNWK